MLTSSPYVDGAHPRHAQRLVDDDILSDDALTKKPRFGNSKKVISKKHHRSKDTQVGDLSGKRTEEIGPSSSGDSEWHSGALHIAKGLLDGIERQREGLDLQMRALREFCSMIEKRENVHK
jgi:hypothetical protein